MTRPEIIKHTKAYMKAHSISKADVWTANDLIEFAAFILKKNAELIDNFINKSVESHKQEREHNVKKYLRIGAVWFNIKKATKMIVDLSLMIDIKEHPEDYDFVCVYPHADNDYTYYCNNPHCKCKANIETGILV